ncbi:VCBS repeat domain-containing M23 family metallopeptidase [Streptomyces clavuligerus]|nr:VCBS repeat domain-containing M23 family metallopeptidase [Streptomyces clavuligerus]
MHDKNGSMMSQRLAGTALSVVLAASALTLGAASSAQAGARPDFQLPFRCGEVWQASTYPGHDPIGSVDFNQYPGDDTGKPVAASANGTVTAAGPSGGWAGTRVRIDHGGGWTTHYAHLSGESVSVGQAVKAGQVIGKVGNTGNSRGAHLHFEQTLDGTGQTAVFDGISYPGSTRDFTSNNCGTGPGFSHDFSGDGKSDVLAKAAATADIHLYEGNGGGGFKAGTGQAVGNNFSALEHVTVVGDWDGDGRDDLVARNRSTGDLHLYAGNGSGGFKAGTGQVIGNNFTGFDRIIGAGDFDGDSRTDLVVRSRTTTDLHLYAGNGKGGFKTGTGQVIGTSWAALGEIAGVGDWSGDGRADLLAKNRTTGDIHLYEGNGSGGFKAGTGQAVGNNFTAFDQMTGVGDFNNDGHNDIVTRKVATGTLHLFAGNGSGGFKAGTGTQIGTGWNGMTELG